ncbi:MULTISPECIES: decaprenyl-phosphate phosphoribosyltransferase [unclassified Nocardioides]|uniref:decaprenyl-phosphate phosphoribosyltransferase n=1 Tax=unclassified Nocardioides TaxID=2615069 RepID=UPI002AA29B24|nr:MULTISPECIES: decaprenyl-phosphate phosphoribosyltransferase [unclassified Nocardioides]
MTPIAIAIDPPPASSDRIRDGAVLTGGKRMRPTPATTSHPRLAAVNVALAVVRSMRPRQWVKNVLVVAAPLAAGDIGQPGVLGATLIAFVSFCLASSAVYLVNDCVDREADRVHPRKRFRPIAAGQLSVGLAVAVAICLVVVAAALSYVASWELLVLLLAYVAIQVLYSAWLKHEPVIDLMLVAAGFLMRAVAGGLAASIEISDWFLLVAGFGSLFMVAGKRYSELHTLGSEAGTRRSLVRYTASYLRFVWSTAAGVTIAGYSLWAFSNSGGGALPWLELSIIPFVGALLRYAVDIDAGTAAEPEDIVWRDRVLQGIGVLWLVVLTLGILDV